MPGILLHEKTVAGSCTIASRVGPQDWNSTHQQFITLVGNTLGASTISGTNIRLSGGANITLSADGQSLGIVGGAGGGGIALAVPRLSVTGTTQFTSGTITLTNNTTLSMQPGTPSYNKLINVIPISSTAGDMIGLFAQPNFHNERTMAWGFTESDANHTVNPVLMPHKFLTNESDYKVQEVQFQINSDAGWNPVVLFPSWTDEGTHTVAFHDDLAGFLTTAALSNHSHGNPSLALTNLSGTTGSASNGLTLSLSALHSNAITEIRVSGTPPTGSTGSVTNGLFVFTNPSVGVTSAAQPNIIPLLDGNTLAFRVYPEFYHHRWWAWGVYTGTATALMPFWEVNQGNTMQDVWFDISGGSAYQELVWPGVSDANSHTIAIWDHLPVMGMSNLGNTSGTSGVVQSGNARLLLAGGANITLSQSINGQSATVSIVGGAGVGGGVAISASNSLWSSGTVTLTGSQNITIGTAAGQIVVTGPDLSPYLTTAALSNHSHGNPSLALTNLSGTTGSNSAGLTLSLSAAAPGAGGGVAISASDSMWTSGTVVLSGSRNITVGTGAGSIIITGPDLAAYLTTAALSNHSHGNPTLNLTNLSGTTGSNSGGLTLSLSAAAPADAYLTITQGQQISLSSSVNGSSVTLTISATNVAGTGTTFAGANLSGSMTLNSAGLNMSMSAAAPGAGGGIAISASNSMWTSGTVTLTGSQNITVGTAAGQIVITGPDLAAYLTTAAQVSHSHGNPTLALTNLGGTTASASNGLTLSLSGHPVIGISASNSLWSSGTVTVTGSRNITVGTAAGQIVITGPDLAAYLTTAAQVSHSHGNPTLALTNLSGTTASNSAGLTLSLSAAAPGAGGGIAAGVEGSTTWTSGTVFLSAQANVTINTSDNGDSHYARFSVADPGGGAGFTKSIKFLNEDLIGFNTGTVASSEGTQYIWSPFHMDSPMSCSQMMMLKSLTCATATSSNSSGNQALSYALSAYIFKRKDYAASSASLTYYTSASGGLSVRKSHTSNSVSFYASWVTDSTGGTSSFSTTSTASAWATAITGPRFFMIPLVTSFSQGEWFLGLRHSSTTATTGSNAVVMTVSHIGYSMQTGAGFVHAQIGSSNTNRSNPYHGIGFGSATAITTNADMNATVISAGSSALRLQHAVMVNMPWPM